MDSSSLPPAMEVGEYRNWAELPPELTSSILHRLGAIEILENAQKVCRSWRRVCKDPSMWRKIDMHNSDDMECDLEIMCRHAVDRSQGGLVEIDLWYFGTDDLLNYIADRSSNLRSLRLKRCSYITDDGFVEAVVKLPLLEELEVSYGSLSGESLKVIGQSCLKMTTLKLNRHPQKENDDDALAIAETMLGLRHLQMFGNGLSDTGLNAVLDSCPKLEHLDLRRCLNVNLVGDLQKRCSERVKVVRHPNDSTHDYPFDASFIDMGSSDDEYPYGFSDIDLMSDDEYDDFYGFSGASDHSDDDPFDYYDDMLF
ncbi:PREDICTED: F-box protein SKIP19-like [Camelina sativa]|uniref:F-box protein SKIP19-like n=1 Tax=Camelina sativa TaxID=90675 RepID=A0ABM0T8D7_CAMSA|nr:PREDICTED: F-box protein SKIP19-like [Camelina sativa]